MKATECSPLFDELSALYAAVDRAFSQVSCDASTECCRPSVTGREPYPTAIERALLARAMRATGASFVPAKGSRGTSRGRSRPLPLATELPTCPLLSDEGRCRVYAARPFGCRTFFCSRANGPMPHKSLVRDYSQQVSALSQRFAPTDPGPRPLRQAFPELARGLVRANRLR